MSKERRALIVFAKVPQANKVKTRLTALLSPQEAADLYEAFLKDAIDVYVGLEVDVRLYFSPSDLQIPEALQPAEVSVHQQKGEDLGARMAAAFAETFVAGYREVVIIGTDHPTLPTAFISQAYEVLADPKSISIGPSDDGGYYLLGMNSFFPQVFQDMTYSHDQVFKDTLDRAERLSAGLHVLPEWYDVDDPNSLRRLVQDLKQGERGLLRTRAMIAELKQSYPELEQS